MSVTITQVTIGSVDDKRLTLGNAQWAAKLDIGTNWTKLRVGMRFAFSDLSVNVFGSPQLFLGVMAQPASSLTNGPLSDSCNHFLGYRSADASWTRVNGASDYYTGTTNNAVTKKVLSTITTGQATSVNYHFSYKETANRNIMMVEVEKIDSTNTDVTHAVPTSIVADTGDFTAEEHATAMEHETLTGAANYLGALASDGDVGGELATKRMTTDETADGEWNSIVVAWNRTNPLLYISEMFFVKLA